MSCYSDRLKEMIYSTAEQCATAEFNISNTVLHDVILMDVHAYTMKFVAEIKRKRQHERNTLEARIDQIQNSEDPNVECELNELKEKVENMNDKED